MDVETYNHLWFCELKAALHQARHEIAEGKGIEESVEEHIKCIQKSEA
ncbi:MAG: hypothetical protein R6V55_14530 [Desulfovermiculus sp.]